MKAALKGKKLLSVLFVCMVFPTIFTLWRSTTETIRQEKVTARISGRYVARLAESAVIRYEEGDTKRTSDFLALLSDRGYERAVRGPYVRPSGERPPKSTRRTEEKFIPGIVAYMGDDRRFIQGSKGAEILASLWTEDIVPGEPAIGHMTVNGEEVRYTLCVLPVDGENVFVVAAVTWTALQGGSGSTGLRFMKETGLVALVSLTAMFFLRIWLIRPLRILASKVRSLQWGHEVPHFAPSSFLNLPVEEIASLQEAVEDLAQRAVDKADLEKRYVADIVKAQEEERNRLAREIHDGPIQVVSALIQRIQIAQISSESRDKAADAVHQMKLAEEAAQVAVDDLRGICDSLVPPWVSLGTARCMEETADRLARQYGIEIVPDVDLLADLPQEKTLALFRIFQEGVSNAVRHGGAGYVELFITKDDAGKIRFLLVDDGCGFDAGNAVADDLFSQGKRGLIGMRQRVEAFGGDFRVRSEKGRGTRIELSFDE